MLTQEGERELEFGHTSCTCGRFTSTDVMISHAWTASESGMNAKKKFLMSEIRRNCNSLMMVVEKSEEHYGFPDC